MINICLAFSLDNSWVQIGIALILLACAIFLLQLTKKKQTKGNTQAMVYGAVCVSIAAVLNLFKFKTGVFLGGISGSVTMLRTFPLVLYAVVFGTPRGLIVCIAYGLVDMLFGLDASGGIVQVLLDYIVAFGLIGLAGLARKSKSPYIFGTLIATAGRFASSFVSGAVFFGMYAPEFFQNNIWAYSLVYQCVTVLPDMLLVLIAFALVSKTKTFNQIVYSMKRCVEGDDAENQQTDDNK